MRLPKALVFAFDNGAATPSFSCFTASAPISPAKCVSADRFSLGHVRGADLIAHGFEIMPAPESSAQVLVLEPAGAMRQH